MECAEVNISIGARFFYAIYVMKTVNKLKVVEEILRSFLLKLGYRSIIQCFCCFAVFYRYFIKVRL